MDVSFVLSLNSIIYVLIVNSLQGTIIFSIHQARYSILKLFDNILLICKGKSVYHGPALDMIDYFNTQGYLCELHDNPADFVLDVLIDVSQKPKHLKKLNETYLESEMHANIDSLLRKQLRNDSLERFCREQQGAAARSFSTEVYYISQRTLKNSLRNPEILLSHTLIATILGFLEGLVFYDMKKTNDFAILHRLAALCGIIMTQMLCAETSLEPFLEERVLFIHVNFVSIYSIKS
jgi:ATP-binding cassette subfamily G (WHITE) protein 2